MYIFLGNDGKIVECDRIEIGVERNERCYRIFGFKGNEKFDLMSHGYKKHEEAESEIEGIFDCMEDGKVKIRSFCGSQYYDFSEEEEDLNAAKQKEETD